MLIERHKNGPTTVEIYDDYIRSREESEEILQRVADNMLRQINAQIAQDAQEETAGDE